MYSDEFLNVLSSVGLTIEDVRVLPFNIGVELKDSITQKAHDKSGFIYMLETNLGLKIGKSRHPMKRTDTILNSVPMKLKSSFISKELFDYTKVEKLMHTLFDGKRMKGEWFDVDMEEVKEEYYRQIDRGNIKETGHAGYKLSERPQHPKKDAFNSIEDKLEKIVQNIFIKPNDERLDEPFLGLTKEESIFEGRTPVEYYISSEDNPEEYLKLKNEIEEAHRIDNEEVLIVTDRFGCEKRYYSDMIFERYFEGHYHSDEELEEMYSESSKIILEF